MIEAVVARLRIALNGLRERSATMSLDWRRSRPWPNIPAPAATDRRGISGLAQQVSAFALLPARAPAAVFPPFTCGRRVLTQRRLRWALPAGHPDPERVGLWAMRLTRQPQETDPVISNPRSSIPSTAWSCQVSQLLSDAILRPLYRSQA